MTSTPLKKLFVAAGGYFGPGSGLGALDYGALGEMRMIQRPTFALPIRLEAPFVWELHLMAEEDLPNLALSLDGLDDTPSAAALRAWRRTDMIGVAAPGADGPVRSLAFRIQDPWPACRLFLLGLTLLPMKAPLIRAPNTPAAEHDAAAAPAAFET